MLIEIPLLANHNGPIKIKFLRSLSSAPPHIIRSLAPNSSGMESRILFIYLFIYLFVCLFIYLIISFFLSSFIDLFIYFVTYSLHIKMIRKKKRYDENITNYTLTSLFKKPINLIAHFQKEWQTGAKIGTHSIIASFGGTRFDILAHAKALN